MTEITPELLLRAYASGIFPMAEDRDSDSLFWVDPEKRGILPLDAFRIPKRLARTIRDEPYQVSVDTAFGDVLAGCAAPTPGRGQTWINAEIVGLYTELHRMGFAHSVECWQEGELVGGLYGVVLGGAFFGESMFHRARDASKIALAYLVVRLKYGGFTLLDTQFVTEHLKQFGATEVPRDDYHALLQTALAVDADFYRLEASPSATAVLQSITQTS